MFRFREFMVNIIVRSSPHCKMAAKPAGRFDPIPLGQKNLFWFCLHQSYLPPELVHCQILLPVLHRSFTCAAPKLWNVLTFDIRSASTVSIFKAKIKTRFFLQGFLS